MENQKVAEQTAAALELVSALDDVLEVADIVRREDKYILSLMDGNQVEVLAGDEDLRVDFLVRVRGVKLQDVGGNVSALVSYVEVVLAEIGGTYV